MTNILNDIFGQFCGGDTNILFFFLLLIILFCSCGCGNDDNILFFFLLLIILFSGSGGFCGLGQK